MPPGPLKGFPFTAVVGADSTKKAIACAIVNPDIRSVLITGGTGSAKTTLARSVSNLVAAEMVNCPANVTEEQLFGGLDVEKTLSSGKPESMPGMLARADGNILYIDDVDLMERSVLAGIMDAVQTGTVKLERGPVSTEYRCKTLLIATMGSEGPGMSPHMLDRFDLSSYIMPAEDSQRAEIIRRNTDDREELAKRFESSEREASEDLCRAMGILSEVRISDDLMETASELAYAVGAEGSRGDISTVHCARSIAALDGRKEVSPEDLEAAAVFALAHRRSEDFVPPEPPPEQTPNRKGDEDEKDKDGGEDDESGKELPENMEHPGTQEMLFAIGREFRIIDYLEGNERLPAKTKTRKGRRAMAISADGTGRYVRSKIPSGKTTDIAFDATVRAAAPYQRVRNSENVSIVIEKSDLREKVRERRSGATLMFLVDASGSLGVRSRMETVKGAILSMLKQSYVKRDRIGMMAFRRRTAEMILPPTKSVEYCYDRLEELPTGGKTPLAEALVTMGEFMTSYARCHIGERCFAIVVTDGRGNVPLSEGRSPKEEILGIAEGTRIPGVRWIVIDASAKFPRTYDAEELAEALEARYYRLEELDADRFAEMVKGAVDDRS